MDTLNEFRKLMEEQTDIALATIGANGIPNVRIVNFYFNPEDNILYFATFKNNNKVKELKENQNVAFTTIPLKENEHVKACAIATKSKQTIFDLADGFCKKIPDYQETIDYGGKSLIVYEVRFETAIVTLDLTNSKKLKL